MAQTNDSQDTPDNSPQASEQTLSAQQGDQGTSLSETIAGITGLLLLLATIGFLVYQGLLSNGPPDIAIETTNIVTRESGYLVEIIVINRGGHTAEGLIVTGELMPKSPPDGQDSNQPVESAQTTFAYVPPQSQRQGGLIFSHNPLDYNLELHAGGYTTP